MEIIIGILGVVLSLALGLPQLIISYLQFKLSQKDSKNKPAKNLEGEKIKAGQTKRAPSPKIDVSYDCRKAKRSDLTIINKIATKAFGLERVSDTSLMEDWYIADPAMFHIIVREKSNSSSGIVNNKVVGYFSVMRITENAVSKLFPNYAPIENVLSSDIDRDSQIVYIGAIVGTDNYTKGIVMSNLVLYLKEKIESGKIAILYARPVSDDGHRLLSKYNFVKCSTVEDCNLYKKADFTE